jgi:hypothetical protein
MTNDQHHQALYNYLNSLRSEAGNEFTESVLDISWQVWQKLRDYFQGINLCLEVPDACVGYQDNLLKEEKVAVEA